MDLVRHLTGVQAQVLSAAALALQVRSEGLTQAAVDRARLRDRSIVLTWAMRGTLHLIPAEDHGWLVPLLTEPRIANAHRRLKQEGVPEAHWDRAVRAIERTLTGGPATRAEIASTLRRRGIRTEGQAIAHLLWLASSSGALCQGPDRDGQPAFVLARDWLAEPRTRDRDAALAELAVRYLRAHAPAAPEDLAHWSGLRMTDARRGWAAIEDRLQEVATARGARWSLRDQRELAPRGLVRLLPAFDEYLLGWKDRDLVGPAAAWKTINRGGGWLHPVVLADGRALGTWRRADDAGGLELHPFGRLAPAVRRAAEREAKRLPA